MGHSTRRTRRVVTLVVASALAIAGAGGYAVAASDDSAEVLTSGGWNGRGSAFSLEAPPGWDGRVHTDPQGAMAILQAASFELLPPGPVELPRGEEDPIKAMGPGDVLVTVLGGATGEPVPRELDFGDLRLLPFDAGRVPRGHALAQGTFCWQEPWQCLLIEVDFGGRPPSDELVAQVDEVLASLEYGPLQR